MGRIADYLRRMARPDECVAKTRLHQSNVHRPSGARHSTIYSNVVNAP